MDILVLENEPTSQRGGQEWCLLDICRGLAEHGHEIHLVYNKEGDFLANYQEFCQSLVQVDSYLISQFRGKTPWLLSLQQLIHLTPDVDVIYVNQYTDNFFGGILAKIKGVPLVCHLHFNLPIGWVLRAQKGIGLKYVTRFITVSEATRSSYVKAGFDPQTIEVVYNGIDLERFALKDDRDRIRRTLGLPLEAFVVIYAGRLDRPKNIEMLLVAFAQLDLTAEQAQLLIVGGPLLHKTPEAGEAYVQELKSLCDRLAISNRVHWLGRRADLPKLFRAADVSVLPSIQPETFGRVLVESMACGTPAIGLKYRAIPEVLSGEFERFQINVGDISGLAHLLQSLNGWQQHDPTLGQRCRAYVEEHFSKERMVKGVERVLQQAVTLGSVQLGPSVDSLKAWLPDSVGI